MLREQHGPVALVGDERIFEAQAQHLDDAGLAAPRLQAHEHQVDEQAQGGEEPRVGAARELPADRGQQHGAHQQDATAREADEAEHAAAGDADERRQYHRLHAGGFLGHEEDAHRAPAGAVEAEQGDRAAPPARHLVVAAAHAAETPHVGQAHRTDHELEQEPATHHPARPIGPQDDGDENGEGETGEQRRGRQLEQRRDALVVDVPRNLVAAARFTVFGNGRSCPDFHVRHRRAR